MHQRDIYHRHLIDDNDVCLQWVLFIPLETCMFIHAARQLQQPVNCFCLVTGGLTHPLRCTAGRRCQCNIHAF